MADILKIVLQAELDESSLVNIQKQIDNLSKNAKAIKLNINVDDTVFKNIETINKQLNEISQNINIDDNGVVDKITHQLKFTKEGSTYLNKVTTEITNQYGEQVKLVEQLNNKTNELEKKELVITNNKKKSLQEEQKIQEAIAKTEMNRIKQREKEAQIQAKYINKALEENYKLQQKLTERLELYKQRMLGFEDVPGELDIFATKQAGRFNEEVLEDIRKNIEALNIDTPNLTQKMNELNTKFKLLKETAKQSGSILARTFENAYKFMRFYLVGGILVRFINSIRDGIISIKELDTSLTELSKVSELAGNQLIAFADKAYEAGRAIGRTGKEVIDATTEFKRAGFDLQEAFELSQQALLLTNIGDGIEDVTYAASSLIAVLKGFKMETMDTAHVVDVLNEVSNNMAIDVSNLTEILRRTSGTLAQTGTSFEELVALGTAAYESLRNAEMVSSGLIMISQRLRGMEETGERIEGLIPSIQEAFDKYTKGAVSIIDEQNGGLKSTYEILESLHKVYGNLTDEAKAYLNELIAGNRQSKILVAIMENWEAVEKSINAANNSLNSAAIENEKYLDSIEGRISRLSSAIEMFWKNLIDSDTIKGFVTVLEKIVTTMDKLVNNTISEFILQVSAISLSIAGLIHIFTKFSVLDKIMNSTLVLALRVIAIEAATNGLAAAFSTLTDAMLASPLFWTVAGTATIIGIIKAVDALTTSLEEQKEVVEILSTEVSELQTEYDKLKAEENRTEEQEKYLALLEQELEAKKELQKIETERLINQEFFTRSIDPMTGIVFEDSGADKIREDIKELLALQEELDNATTKEAYDKINEKILNIKTSLSDSLKTMYNYADIMGNDTPKELSELIAAIEEVIITQEELNEEIETATVDYQQYSQSLEELTEQFDEVTTKIQEYYKILNELNTEEGLSAETKQEIITKYQELLPYLSNEQELRQQLIRIIAEEEKAQKQAYVNMLMVSEDFYNAKIKGNADLVNELQEYYNKDLENAKSLAEAKMMVERRLVSNLAKLWADFYKVTAEEGLVETMGAGGRVDNLGRNMQQRLALERNRISRMFEDIALKYGGLDFKSINMAEIDTGTNTTSKSTQIEKQYLDTIEAEIRAIQIKNDKLIETRNLLEEQLELAKDDDSLEGLSKQYELIGQLINKNVEVLQSYKQEQQEIHALANKIREQYSQYDIDSWFDENAERTLEYINQYNQATAEQQEEMEKIFNWVQLLKQAWMEANEEIQNVVKTNQELNQEMEDILEQQREIRLEALESIQEKIVEIIKKRGEEEQEALEEAYEKDMELLEERYEARMEKYEEELAAYKKMIQEKINALDKQAEQEDYIDKLNEKREQAAEIQRQIDILSLDDSLTAQNKVAELREDLAKINEEIAEMQQDRERELLKDSLQEQLEEFEETIEEKQEIAEEYYKNEKKRLQEEYEINKKYLEKKYSDEKMYAEAREALMRGQVEVAEGVFVDIYDAYIEFENKFGPGMGILADIIRDEFIQELENAKQAIKELDYLSSNFTGYKRSSNTGTGKLSDMTELEYITYKGNKFRWEQLNAKANKTEEDIRLMQKYAEENQRIRDKYNIPSDDYTYDDLKNISYEELKRLGYKNGGKITKTGTLIAKFHGTQTNPEWIFNDQQFRKILQSSVLSTLRVALPKISPPDISKNDIVLNFDKLINVEGNLTKEVIPQVKAATNDIAEKLVRTLNKNGITRSVKALR